MKTRSLVSLLAALLLGLVLTSCSDDADTAGGVSTSIVSASDVKAAVVDGATVIDVRTPEEYASGHLADAINIDVQSSDFTAQVAELDKAATYVVYCRSGNRSTAAIEAMADMGFTQLINGGAFDSLAAEGLAVS